MKKVITLMLATLLLASVLSACVGDANWSQYCKENKDFFAEFFEFKNHGQCVSYFARSDAAVAADLCRDVPDELEDALGVEFKNHGDCVKQVKENLPNWARWVPAQ